MKQRARRVIEQFAEDIQCWWADLNNGIGDCSKRLGQDECLKQQGMKWYDNGQECLNEKDYDERVR